MSTKAAKVKEGVDGHCPTVIITVSFIFRDKASHREMLSLISKLHYLTQLYTPYEKSKELYNGQIPQQGTITNNCLLQLTFLA